MAAVICMYSGLVSSSMSVISTRRTGSQILSRSSITRLRIRLTTPISIGVTWRASTPDAPSPPKIRSTNAKTSGMATSMTALPLVGPRVNWYDIDGFDSDAINSAYVVWSTNAVSTSTAARIAPENVPPRYRAKLSCRFSSIRSSSLLTRAGCWKS